MTLPQPTTGADWINDWITPATAAAVPPAPAGGGAEQLLQRLDGELATVRAELLRVDTKANSLLALAGVLLGGAVAVLGGSRTLPGPAAAVAWTAVALIAAAVVLLAGAVRPNLGGDFGFVRWSRAGTAQQVLDGLADNHAEPLTSAAGQLRWLSCALLAKYTAVRRAVTLLTAGLGVAAVAATVAMWTR